MNVEGKPGGPKPRKQKGNSRVEWVSEGPAYRTFVPKDLEPHEMWLLCL